MRLSPTRVHVSVTFDTHPNPQRLSVVDEIVVTVERTLEAASEDAPYYPGLR